MSLDSFLNQDIIIYTKGALDGHGRPTFGPAVDYKARFEQENTTITTVQNEREPIDGKVFVSTSCTVGIGDKLTYDETDYRVMRRSKIVVGSGALHHQELLVQLWSI